MKKIEEPCPELSQACAADLGDRFPAKAGAHHSMQDQQQEY